jgi:hypothetical protein
MKKKGKRICLNKKSEHRMLGRPLSISKERISKTTNEKIAFLYRAPDQSDYKVGCVASTHPSHTLGYGTKKT